MTVEIDVTEPIAKLPEPEVTFPNQEKLDEFKQNFDVEAASREGLTDSDIVGYIQEYFPEFDYEQATSEQEVMDERGNLILVPGYTDRELVQFFTKALPLDPAEALAREAERGMLKSAPMTGGLMTGARLGSPFGLPGTVIGGAVGLWSGWEFGDTVDKLLYDQSPYAPSVRPWAEAGTTLGTGAAFPLAPFSVTSKLTPGTIRWLQSISGLSGRTTPVESMLKTAAERPGRFLMAETTALGGSSVGSLYSEKIFPGETYPRIGFEIVGGIFSPISIGTRAIEATAEKIVSLASREARMGRQGVALREWLMKNAPVDKSADKETQAAQREQYVGKIYSILSTREGKIQAAKEIGIDLQAHPELLETRSTASVLDDPVIRGLQAKLGLDPKDGARIRKSIERDYAGLQNLIQIMEASGDPSIISQAAKMRQDYYRSLILRRLDLANLNAVDLISKIKPGDPRAAMNASETVESLTEQAIKDVRLYEKDLYDAVDKTETMSLSNFIDEYMKMEQELLDNEVVLPGVITGLFNKARGTSVEIGEESSQQLARLDRRIRNAEENIAKVRSAHPESVEGAESLYDTTSAFDIQLAEIQEAIRTLEKTPIKDLPFAGPEKNRQLNVLRNRAQIIDAQLSKSDLSRMSETPLAPEAITIGEAMRARSLLLNKAREASSSKRFTEAHFLSDLADSIRDDFGIASGGDDVNLATLTDNQKALKKAFGFSSAMNDVFTRAFPGAVLARNRSGARKIMPELLSKTIFSGGGDATSLKYDELDNAMVFAANELGTDYNATAHARIGSMRAAHSDILRSKFEELIDKDGKVTPDKLFKFNRDYRNVLFDEAGNSRFPELTESLSDLKSAQEAVDIVTKRQGRYQDALENSFIFSQLPLAGTNPRKLISNVLGTPKYRGADDPTGAFVKLIRQAKSADAQRLANGQKEGAVKGLKDVVLEEAWSYSSGVNSKTGVDEFNFKAYSDYLTTPLKSGGLSPLAIMQREGVLSSGEATRLAYILKEGVKVQGQRGLAKNAQEVAGEPVGLGTRGLDTFVRLVGLRIGRKATQMAPGQGQGLAEPAMIANEFGMLLNIPRIAHRDLLLEAMENPEVFKLLLEKADNIGPKSINRRRRLNSFLLNAGLISAEDAERDRRRRQADPRQLKVRPDNLREREAAPEERPRREVTPRREEDIPGITSPLTQLDRTPAAPTVAGAAAPRPAPFVVAQAPVASPPPAQQARPADRSRFAAAFPSDITAPFIKQQGIETLLS